MANLLDPMDIKQILTLHKGKESNREIARILGISRNTVNDYIKRCKASGYSAEQLLAFDNLKLSELFTCKTTQNTERQDELMQYFEGVNKARNHPGFTFLFHYNEYVQTAKEPYSYTQFLDYYRKKYGVAKGSMKLEHEPGKEIFVDYAGKKLQIANKQTGEAVPVEVFVAILPNSQYTYVEACTSQKQEDFIQSCENALHFFGGVPKAIVSDNLKSAVKRSSRHEPVINRNFKEFARHYECVINPTRAYAPQDKALVENAVHLTYQKIYYPLRGMTFFTMEDLNKEIHRLLEGYNKLLFQRKAASRRELFQTIEREYLKPLAATRYEIKSYRRAKVQKMGYVYFSPDKSYYSVPYRYIGKHTLIHYTARVVEIYHDQERIAFHQRNYERGVYNTNKDHLSSAHKAYSTWSPEYFKERASQYGVHVVRCVEVIFSKVAYPEIGYKRVTGLLQLHKAYGSDRLDRACEKALENNTVSYLRIKNILENNMDQASLFYQELEDQNATHIPQHNNIRGAEHYK